MTYTTNRPAIQRRLALVLIAAASTLYAVGCTPSAPIPPPYDFGTGERYLVAGRGTARVEGLDVAGTFELELLDRGGVVTIQRFVTRIRSFDVVRHFLFIETAREKFRCTEASNVGPMTGTVDGSGNLRLASGARIQAISYDAEGTEGSCPGTGRIVRFEATSDREVTGVHNPSRDRFSLRGTFRTTVEGDSLDMALDLEGHYVNRPPVAVIGVEGPGYDLSQGGCPPLVGVNPPIAEANHPDGLRLTLISSSYDPDGRVRTDLGVENWAHWQGVPSDPASPYRFLGAGRVVGSVLFRFSPTEHFLRLAVTDRYLADGQSGCRFQVADRTAPAVSAPFRTTVPCTEAGGARPRASDALATLLASSSARDLADPAPVQQPTLLGTAEVTGDTLLPPGRSVLTFRYSDFSGNVGTQDAVVDVGDGLGGCG